MKNTNKKPIPVYHTQDHLKHINQQIVKIKKELAAETDQEVKDQLQKKLDNLYHSKYLCKMKILSNRIHNKKTSSKNKYKYQEELQDIFKKDQKLKEKHSKK